MQMCKIQIMGLCLLTAAGCNGPLAFVPGGQLAGPEESAATWEVAGGYETLELETRPGDPYSVRVNFVLRNGRLYVDPAPDRSWYEYLGENPQVRVRFADTIYTATAVAVTDPAELRGFDADRRVFRLEPRS